MKKPLMNKKLLENIVALFSLKGIEYIISFITLPYLLHVLGPSRYGAVVFAQSLIAYGNIMVDYGFNITAPKDVARAEKSQIRVEFSSIFIAKIVLLIITLIIITFLLIILDEKLDTLLILCVTPSLIGNAIFPIWYYQGIQKMKYITIFNVFARMFSVLGIFVLVKNSSDYCIAALIQSITPLLAGVLSVLYLLKNNFNLFCVPKYGDIKKKYSDGWDVFISTVFINIYTSSNIVILRILTNDVYVGYYSAANKIIEVLKGGLTPVSNAIFPHVSILAEKSRDDAIIFLQRAVRILGGISLILSIVMFVFADEIVELIMGDAYEYSVEILKIISFLPFVVSLSNVFGIQTMIAFGMQRMFSYILMVSAILNFLLVFPLISYFQAIGLAVTVLFVECFVTMSMYYILRKENIDLIFHR